MSRLYTDLAVIDVADGALRVIDLVAGLDFGDLQARTGALLVDARS